MDEKTLLLLAVGAGGVAYVLSESGAESDESPFSEVETGSGYVDPEQADAGMEGVTGPELLE